MTEIYCLHRQDQLDAARAEFADVWRFVIALHPNLNTPSYQQRAWLDFLRSRKLLPPKPPAPPTK